MYKYKYIIVDGIGDTKNREKLLERLANNWEIISSVGVGYSQAHYVLQKYFHIINPTD